MSTEQGEIPGSNAEASGEVPVLYPALLALYPVLGLYAHNSGKIALASVIRPAVVVVLVSILLVYILRRLFSHRYKGGLAAGILVVATLSGWSIYVYAMDLLLPQVAGYPNWFYYLAYAVVFIVMVSLVTWRTRAVSGSGLRNAFYLLLIFAVVLLLSEGVFTSVFARGPAWFITTYWLLVAGLLVYVARSDHDYRALTVSANWFGVILLGLSLVNVAYHRPKPVPFTSPPPLQSNQTSKTSTDPAQRPDIYFIVMGGHGRADVHSEEFGYNEAPFIHSMKDIGFEYAPDSLANYPNTVMSLASCLNMDYLQNLPSKEGDGAMDVAKVIEYVHNNRVYDFLKSEGYRLLVFSQGTEALEPRSNVDKIIRPKRAVSEFEIVLMENSAVAPAIETVHYLLHHSRADMRHIIERGRVYQALNRLEQLPEEKSSSPRFIFAYFSIPEPPFLFTRDGGWPRSAGAFWYAGRVVFAGDEKEYREGYRDQLAFTNRKIEEVAHHIVDNATRPSVVLIVSAHGPSSALAVGKKSAVDLKERFANLELAYFPHTKGKQQGDIYQSMSLVNLFRETFNRLFNTSFPILDDKAYVVNGQEPFKYKQIPVPLTQ